MSPHSAIHKHLVILYHLWEFYNPATVLTKYPWIKGLRLWVTFPYTKATDLMALWQM